MEKLLSKLQERTESQITASNVRWERDNAYNHHDDDQPYHIGPFSLLTIISAMVTINIIVMISAKAF